jgi:hypothetical protein
VGAPLRRGHRQQDQRQSDVEHRDARYHAQSGFRAEPFDQEGADRRGDRLGDQAGPRQAAHDRRVIRGAEQRQRQGGAGDRFQAEAGAELYHGHWNDLHLA